MCSFYKLLSFFYIFGFNLIPFSIGESVEYSLADHQLSKIMDKQVSFFKKAPQTSKKELTRKAQEIVSLYEAYISENHKDTHALILFGKFLQQVGQSEHAVDYFLHADSINPKHAVVKQQLANYLIEQGRPVDAFPFLMMTIQLDPKVSAYHYQIGNFLHIFQSEIIETKLLAEHSLKSFMCKSFEKAFSLSPRNFNYGLRYAQSFFDCPEISRHDALRVWNDLSKNFPDLIKSEKDYIKLCKARILLELNRKRQAKELIDSVSTSSLKKSKNSLLKQVMNRKPKKKNNSLMNPLKEDSSKTGKNILMPDDSHLKRMRELSFRLHEEKLLSNLETDAISASADANGKITLKFGQGSERFFMKEQN